MAASAPKSGLQCRERPYQECVDCPIRKMALFGGVPDDRLAWTQEHRSAQNIVSAKRHLYREGQVCGEGYTLFSGWAMLYRGLPDGKRQIVRFALPGDYLSFEPALSGPSNHSVQAITECVVCTFPRAELVDLFQRDASLSMRLNWIKARDMALCQEHLLSLGRKNAGQRIAFLLMELFERVRRRGAMEDSNSIHFPLTQEHIADATGLTVVHTNRVLRQLRELALIRCANQRLCILDEKELADLGGFNPCLVEPQQVL